ncbi:MAG: FAD:protein FMN transferase [Undibacterium sp.]
MTSFRTIERHIEKQIMNTDVLIRIASDKKSKEEMERSITATLRLMQEFADRYSRFIEGNDLWQFNQSAGGPVSSELFDLLSRAKQHHEKTAGRFDPSILPALEQEGYTGAYTGMESTEQTSFNTLELNPATQSARKPISLKIDFGGFGKGYIVDHVAAILAREYPHILVDAGGDITVRGQDVGRGESSWIIGVENPTRPGIDLCLLALSDCAVATSGKNRRTWKSAGVSKHHLIDPKTKRSSESDLLSVSVIAASAEEADVMAKTLFLMGSTVAQEFADTHQVPALFYTRTDTFSINNFAQPYVFPAA